MTFSDPRRGPKCLDPLAAGLAAPAALERLTAEAPSAAYRRLDTWTAPAYGVPGDP